MRRLTLNFFFYSLKIRTLISSKLWGVIDVFKPTYVSNFLYFSKNKNNQDIDKNFKLFVYKVFVLFFTTLALFYYYLYPYVREKITKFFIKISDLYNNISNNFIEFNYLLIGKKMVIVNYLEAASYFLIFLSLLFYFFNVFFLSFATTLFGVRGVFVVSFLSILFFWAVQFWFLKDFFYKSAVFYLNFDFLNFFIGSLNFSFSLKIDFLNFSFLFLTTTIGLCAIVYSLSYFKNEPNTDRFILYINWFILSMSLLVVSDNALLLFLGWELIGLTSFLLINFWTLRRGTLKSAIKAFTFNKISDVLLLFFIIIISHQTNSLSLSYWSFFFSVGDALNTSYMSVPGIFLIGACSIKSAQIFGHLWLPDSMEAPIPASALIHSATLVSAGVYLLLKFNWAISNIILTYVIFILGCLTSLYGAVVSAAQTDCKKLLAYSTISHCGFLFVTIAINNNYLTITYLYLHGFFKALTFFCVGNLVKVSKNQQDTRKMGQLYLLLPVESALLVFCSINLGALPFTIGYFYKYLFQNFFLDVNFLFILYPFLLFAMLASVIYVFRLIFYSLFDVQKNNENIYEFYLNPKFNDDAHSNSTILGSLFIFLLTIFSIFLLNTYILYFKNFLIYVFHFNVTYSELNFMSTSIEINYLLYFYIFFSSVVGLLLTIECRSNFNHQIKKEVLFFLFCTLSLSQIYLTTQKILLNFLF